MTGMSFFGLFVIILILISFSIIIAEELRRKEEKRERTKMENITIMVVGWGLMILAIPLTIYLFISTDRKSTRLNSSHREKSRMPSSA